MRNTESRRARQGKSITGRDGWQKFKQHLLDGAQAHLRVDFDAYENFIRRQLRKKFGPDYRNRFEIRTCEGNRAISVHWRGEPDEAVIQAIGKPLVTGWPRDDGLWFFQTQHSK